MNYHHVNDTSPKARNRYLCVGCGEFIDVGELHLKRFGYGEAGPQSDRWHFECEEYAFADGECVYESSPGCFSRDEAKSYLQKPLKGGC